MLIIIDNRISYLSTFSFTDSSFNYLCDKLTTIILLTSYYLNLRIEEILGTNSAIWMSNDGHMMVFASFNDTLVEELRFPWYGSPSEDRLYPDIRSLRYPKPGTRNPKVRLTVADLADPSNIRMREVKAPSSLNGM